MPNQTHRWPKPQKTTKRLQRKTQLHRNQLSTEDHKTCATLQLRIRWSIASSSLVSYTSEAFTIILFCQQRLFIVRTLPPKVPATQVQQPLKAPSLSIGNITGTNWRIIFFKGKKKKMQLRTNYQQKPSKFICPPAPQEYKTAQGGPMGEQLSFG